MASVVFLRAINVGKANRCQPAQIAKQLGKFDVINIGAVGTFVVRKPASQAALRAAIAQQLPFKCDMMIVPGRDLLELAAREPFRGQPRGPDITHFVNVLAKPLPKPVPVPHFLPSPKEWLVKVVAVEKRFVLGLYRRQMKAIGYLGKLEKQLGVPATNRNWNTIEKVIRVLEAGSFV